MSPIDNSKLVKTETMDRTRLDTKKEGNLKIRI